MIFGHRWQSFPRGSTQEKPDISARAVNVRHLEGVLPPGIRRIDAAGRHDQLVRREAGFLRRFIDH